MMTMMHLLLKVIMHESMIHHDGHDDDDKADHHKLVGCKKMITMFERLVHGEVDDDNDKTRMRTMLL